jgi:hypothetical protein
MSVRRRCATLASALALTSPACGVTATASMPRCEPSQRLGIVAQSVPGAAYLPCIAEMPPGWSFESFDVDDDGTRFSLRSDRSDRPVDVELAPTCDVGSATPVAPRDEGGPHLPARRVGVTSLRGPLLRRVRGRLRHVRVRLRPRAAHRAHRRAAAGGAPLSEEAAAPGAARPAGDHARSVAHRGVLRRRLLAAAEPVANPSATPHSTSRGGRAPTHAGQRTDDQSRGHATSRHVREPGAPGASSLP